MEIKQLWRFGDDVIDLNEVVALVGNCVYLREGERIGVGDATADAMRKAMPPLPAYEPPQDTPDTPQGKPRDSSVSKGQSARSSSKAQARLPRHSS